MIGKNEERGMRRLRYMGDTHGMVSNDTDLA